MMRRPLKLTFFNRREELDCPSPFLKEKHENLQNGLQKGEKGTIITFVKKYLPKNRLELEEWVFGGWAGRELWRISLN